LLILLLEVPVGILLVVVSDIHWRLKFICIKLHQLPFSVLVAYWITVQRNPCNCSLQNDKLVQGEIQMNAGPLDLSELTKGRFTP
jgi:hypothetical protein